MTAQFTVSIIQSKVVIERARSQLLTSHCQHGSIVRNNTCTGVVYRIYRQCLYCNIIRHTCILLISLQYTAILINSLMYFNMGGHYSEACIVEEIYYLDIKSNNRGEIPLKEILTI